MENLKLEELKPKDLVNIYGGTPTNPGNGIIGTVIGILSFGWGFMKGVVKGVEIVIEANN